MPASPLERSSFLGRALLVLAIVVLGVLAWVLVDVLLLSFAGLLLAVFLGRLTRTVMAYTRLPRRWALAAVVTVLVLLFAGAGVLIGAQVAQQIDALSRLIPEAIAGLIERADQIDWLDPLIGGAEEAMSENGVQLGPIVTGVAGAATTMVSGIASLIVLLFVGLYIAAAPELYRDALVRLVPKARRDRFSEILDTSAATLWSWLKGQLIAMVAVGIMTGVGLMLLGVPQSLALGLIAGLLEFIPIVGPIMAAVPGVLIAFTIDPVFALWVVLFYVIVQQIESNILMPVIQHRMVSLPPAATLLAIAAFGILFGFLGILVATPLMVMVTLWVRMLYVEDVLKDRDDQNAEAAQ
jgi:predicted PurR-regulated permease PerM